MDWDWVATVAVWLLWAVILAVLLVGSGYALRGLAWCSFRSIWRLSRGRYVARRIALSERVICDGERLCYSPRALSSPPKLYFARNVAGWEPGVLTPEACAILARSEISRRSIVLGAVVAAFAVAWTAPILNPAASSAPILAGLFLFSALFAVHTIYPFRLPAFSRFGLSARRSKGGAKDLPSERASTRRADAHGSGLDIPDTFVGSKETLDDLDRFFPLQRHVLGARHESVFVGRYCRSAALFHLDRYDAALADIASYVAPLRKALGDRNTLTLKVRYLKAVNLAALANWPAALEELDAVAPLQADVLGASHPDALMSRSSRVKAWTMLERYAEANKELDTLLQDCDRVFGPDDPVTSANLRLKGIALQKLDGAPTAPEGDDAPAAAEKEPAPPPAPQERAAAPNATALRKAADALIAVARRLPIGGRLAPLAGGTFFGLLLVGAGIFAANPARRESSASTLSATTAQPSPRPATPTAMSQPGRAVSNSPPEEAVSETPAIRLEAGTTPAAAELAGLRVEDYAASMIARRRGAKVREAPNRSAPLVVRVPAGSKLRVTGRTQVADHQWFRVVLPDRRSGFVRDDVVARDRRAIEDFTPASPMAARRAGANVRSAPHIRAPLIVRLAAGSRLHITGRRQASGHTWFRVVVPDGRVGFVRDDVVEAAP